MSEWDIGLGGVGHCPKPKMQTRRYRKGRSYEDRTYMHCKCGKCAQCGFPLHSSVHMHALGGKAGDKPFDHRFVPQPPTDPTP